MESSLAQSLHSVDCVLLPQYKGGSAKISSMKGTIMSVIWMIIVGLIVGAVAKLLMPGRDPGGIIVTMLLGIAGSTVAGYLGRAIGWYGPGDATGFIASVIGAVVLLAIYRAIIGRRISGGRDTRRAA
jgi:uncharacterized membrane protein YeaQ/YmgE (transglycosylase-associated protein family)